jgi:protein-disulfide isomerase
VPGKETTLTRQPSTPTSRRQRREADRAARTGRPRYSPTTAKRPFWKSPTVVITAIAVVAAIGFVAFLNMGPRDERLITPTTSIPSDLANGAVLGSANAPVTLEVWADPQCPACGTFARDYLPRLVTEFVIPGQLRVIDRAIDLPGVGRPNESQDAAAGMICAGRQDAYWDFHDYVYWNQVTEVRGGYTRDRLRAMASAIGLDRSQFDACLNDQAVGAEVLAETQEAARAGVNATPTLDINGERIVGVPREYGALAAAIRQALNPAPSPVP